MSHEQKGLVTMKGSPLTLVGAQARVGEPAPDFRVVDGSFKPVRLSNFLGKVVLISAVPSLDTPVCSLQTKRFNEEAAKLPANVQVITISEDLPFAQKRFCEVEKIGGSGIDGGREIAFFGQSGAAGLRSGRWKYLRPGLWSGTTTLFDLEADPGEKKDLSRDRPDLVRQLEDRLQELL